VPIAELALLKRPALAIDVSSQQGRTGRAAADGALCRISAGRQSNIFGHASRLKERRNPRGFGDVLVSSWPRVVGCDSLILAEPNPYERLPGATVRGIPVWRRIELRLDTVQLYHQLVVSAIPLRNLRSAEVRVGIRIVE
jgi:hypothetical protein